MLEINRLKLRGIIIYKLDFIDLFKKPLTEELKDGTP
jgi:hypothetical protein